MSWYSTTAGSTWWSRPRPEFVDFRDFRTAQAYDIGPAPVETLASQISRMIAENLKVFVRELTEEIKNGSLVFNEQEIEQRIDELFRG